MNKFFRDFVSTEKREFPLKFGGFLASSLAGFVAGTVVASIIWLTAIYIITGKVG